MNNIKNLISIIEQLGGSATIDDITRTYCRSRKMIVDSSYKSIITNVLTQNKDLVRYSSQLCKWELYTDDGQDVLRVSDNKYFPKIRNVMNGVFGIFKFQPQKGYLKIDSSHRAWFPKFDNDGWKNEYDPSGKYWFETPKTASADYQADGMIRYVFSYDKKLGYRFTGVFKPIENQGRTRVYELIDDKVKIQHKRKPLILCRIAWMDNYQGITNDDVPLGGGRYIDNNQDGFEKYNFLLRENGYYGFVETMETKAGSGVYNKICIENIDPSYSKDDSIDGVRVVFISRHPNTNKMLIIGWYDNATIYRERQYIDGNTYMMHCSETDAHLISTNERTFEIPTGKNAIGQSNFFYIQSNVEQRDLEYKIVQYLDSLLENKESNFYYEPVNLFQWDMFKEVEGEGHIEYFLATSNMKIGDYVLLHVGSQKSDVESGVYGVAKILEAPAIYKGNPQDYCHNKLSVKTEVIIYSKKILMKHEDFKKYINQFRRVHRIDSQFNRELHKHFLSLLSEFIDYLNEKVKNNQISVITRDSYLNALKIMNKKYVGNVHPNNIFVSKSVTPLMNLYERLMNPKDEIGIKNLTGNRRMSSALKTYIDFLNQKNIR